MLTKAELAEIKARYEKSGNGNPLTSVECLSGMYESLEDIPKLIAEIEALCPVGDLDIASSLRAENCYLKEVIREQDEEIDRLEDKWITPVLDKKELQTELNQIKVELEAEREFNRSLMSEIGGDAELMRVSEVCSIGGEFSTPCFNCGTKVSRGGHWLGRGQEVALCRDRECVRATIHLVYEAIHDTTEDVGASSEMLNELVAQVLQEKRRRLNDD